MELLNSIMISNDGKASTELYGFYTDEIKKHLKKKFKVNEADSEDLTSDTLIKVLTNLTEYDEDKSNFKTWVITIADNTAINFKNKLSNKIEHEHFVYNFMDDIDKKNFIELPSQEDFEQNFIYTNTLSNLVADLDSESKTMIEMKYVQGYTHTEIGTAFSITSSTASNKINYAKAKLIKKMDKNMGD